MDFMTLIISIGAGGFLFETLFSRLAKRKRNRF